MDYLNKLFLGDCFNIMQKMPAGCVDMILCDLPYGTTACKWDTVLDLHLLFTEYKRLIKRNGAIVLTASQPFTSTLVATQKELFRYEWIWEKEQGVNFLMAKKQPMKVHENVLVFAKERPVYYPQMTVGKPYISGKGDSGEVTGKVKKKQTKNSGTRYPRSIQQFKRETGLHPTQKPVALFEYLIKTYTQPGEFVLDNCIGSGTTAVAAIKTGRNWVGIEKDPSYYEAAKKRINKFLPDTVPVIQPVYYGIWYYTAV